MINISTLNKEEKLKEVITHINKILANQLLAMIIQNEIINTDELSKYLINSDFLDNIYFIIDSPSFETKNEKGQNIVVSVVTYQFDKIEDIENIVISNPKKYIMLYNIYLASGKLHVRCALFDDKLKIRSEKIDKILND
jgi:hypothetical protein